MGAQNGRREGWNTRTRRAMAALNSAAPPISRHTAIEESRMLRRRTVWAAVVHCSRCLPVIRRSRVRTIASTAIIAS